jgi:DNA-binding transcriptional LysR family regulator
MDLKDLRYFVAAYEARGFSRASEQLGTVQSNVSTRILELERRLGVQLFERQWRKLVPTANGEKLYADAKRMVVAHGQTEQSWKPARAT